MKGMKKMRISPEKFESLCKVKTVFDKYLELQTAIRALSEEEYKLLITSLEKSLAEVENA